MITIKPFEALRPQPQLAKLIASKPYDVLSFDEVKKEVVGNPNSFLYVTRSEVALDKNVDIYSNEVYLKAQENLQAFIKRDIIFKESKTCFYIYSLTMGKHIQTGLVCLSSLDDYKNNLIKKHELTRPIKENDRLQHIKFTRAHTGNVFLTYKNVAEIDDIIQKWKTNKTPIYDFIADDQIKHSLWNINEEKIVNLITKLFKEEVPFSYIADGHHRAASAFKYYQSAEKENIPNAAFFLTTLFPANQLKILPYNRLVLTLNNLSEPEFLKKVEKIFLIEKMSKPVIPEAKGVFGLYLKNQWYRLIIESNIFEKSNLADQLDVAILQNLILDKILGIKDPRSDKNIDFVGGIRPIEDLTNPVNNNQAKMAFTLFPPSVSDMMELADNDQIMPPKSTWFEPKLRDGLLTHCF
ncbi:MAG: DUF1015 family protein [Sediminibacterium sp.]|nr:DUF1015 family protein [Sediminibacterium sp.]